MLQAAAGEVARVDQYDVAAPGNSAIAIVHAVDRRVVLIMAPDRRECIRNDPRDVGSDRQMLN